MKTLNYLACIIFLSLIISSCKKEAVKSFYYVRMTDNPGLYNAVNIDLQSIEVTGNSGKVILLNTHQGIYNLLNYSNDLDTLIGSGELDFGSVEQIRLILGSSNSVVVDNISYPLTTPDASELGLKLQVHHLLKAGVENNVLIDFDANQSVVEQGNGKYCLKPVIRVVDIALSGTIRGKILPEGTLAIVKANSNGISYTTTVNDLGYFVIKVLPAGTFSVTITPASPLIQSIVSNIIVTNGNSTDIGIINF